MADVTRKIGLSLGADICWPICYEEMMRRLDLAHAGGAATSSRFAVERVTIEPFDLRQPCQLRPRRRPPDPLVHTSREWIKKAMIMDGLYVFNNPWAVQANEKHTTLLRDDALGMPIPETWMVPPKEYEPTRRPRPDAGALRQAVRPGPGRRAARLPDVHEAVRRRRLGAASAGSTTRPALRTAYEQSGKYVMHLQAAVDPFDLFVRCIGFGPQIHIVSYDPTAPLHDRYTADDGLRIGDDERSLLTRHDAAHQRVLRLGLQLVRGAAEGRRVAPDRLRERLPGLAGDVVALPLPVARRRQPAVVDLLRRDQAADAADPRLAALLRRAPRRTGLPRASSPRTPRSRGERFDTDAFDEFCATHLASSTRCRGSSSAPTSPRTPSAQKVAALFPAHEVEEFTELFWSRVQRWRAENAAPAGPAPAGTA